jgi:imidazolonepropionase-like amidohydrolase
MKSSSLLIAAALINLVAAGCLNGQEDAPRVTLFQNVRVFDGKSDKLTAPLHVLVRGKLIENISDKAISTDRRGDTLIIDGEGRTLMPGLIDAHTHIMFSDIAMVAAFTSDIGFVNVAAAKAVDDMLLRGFTSIRDLGGPVFGLKNGIDLGLARGPRIWPSGALISQTDGHGDFRLLNDMPACPDDFTYTERVGAAAIADDADTVRKRTREQLALGVSQIRPPHTPSPHPVRAQLDPHPSKAIS